jgi:nucleoside-triphosphatase
VIYIFSGKIHSGKTTKLLRYVRERTDIAGILCPVIENKRYLKFIPGGENILLESGNVNQDVLFCGKYKFRKSVFDKANLYLIKIVNENYNWIIIDEAGHLELEDSGLHESINHITKNYRKTLNLILVVRDTLVSSILKKYNIAEHSKIIYDVTEM